MKNGLLTKKVYMPCVAFLLSFMMVFTPIFIGSASLAKAEVLTTSEGIDFFSKAKVGLFTHYTYSFPGYQWGHTYMEPGGEMVPDLNTLANSFDAERFAQVASDMGAQYVTFTLFHAGMSILYPSEVMGSKLPYKVSQRDVIQDLINALHNKGIKLVLYFHPVDGHDLTADEQAALNWGDYTKWNDFINALIDEVGERYGSGVAGFWFDGAPGPDRIDGNRLKSTVLSNNPDAVVWVNYGRTFNPGVKFNGLSDFITSEYFPRPGSSLDSDEWYTHDSQQSMVVGGGWWAQKDGRMAIDAVSMLRYTVRLTGTEGQANGGAHWSAGPYANNQWESGVEETFKQFGDLLKPIQESVYNTVPSASYITKPNTLQKDIWGVATDSLDGNYVYLHVLNPPEGNQLQITDTYDGREFDEATLLINGKQVQIEHNHKGYVLTLPEGEPWSDVDTVIKLKVSVGSSYKDRNVVNRYALGLAISAAQAELEEAVVGTEPGQYPQASVDALEAAIAAAQAVLEDTTATYGDGETAISDLNGAVDAFRRSQILEPQSENLALNKPCEATSAHPHWKLEYATDGNRTGSVGWSSDDSQLNTNHTESIMVDLGNVYNVNKVCLYPRSDGANAGYGFPVDFTIQVSPDKVNWMTVVSKKNYPNPGGAVQRFTFDAQAARFVKVEGTNLRHTPGEGYRMQLFEFEVYGKGLAEVLGENLALKKAVDASSTANIAWVPEFAVDGQRSSIAGRYGWSSGAVEETSDEWIKIDLGGIYKIGRVHLFPRDDGVNAGYGFPVDFTVLTSESGENWTTVVTRSDYPNPGKQVGVFTFNGQDARYIMVRGTKLRANPYDANQYRMQFAEIEVYAAPDKTNLEKAIADATILINNAVPGNGAEQHPQSAIDELRDQIEAAQVVMDDPDAGQSDINAAIAALNTAINIFRSKQNLEPQSRNLALNKECTASSAHLVWTLNKATDGNRTSPTGWSSEGDNYVNHTEWITVDLGDIYNINKVYLFPRNDGRDAGYGFPVDFTIQVSDDNEHWTTVITETDYPKPEGIAQRFYFDAKNARYVKVEGTKLRANPYDYDQYRMQFIEFEVYGPDKEALKTAIGSVQRTLQAAPVGILPGQYKQEKADELSAVIDEAQLIADNRCATQQQVDDMERKLNKAIDSFNKSIITLSKVVLASHKDVLVRTETTVLSITGITNYEDRLDLLSLENANIEYFSTDKEEKVLSRDNNTVTAGNVGSADLYVKVTLGNTEMESNKITITVTTSIASIRNVIHNFIEAGELEIPLVSQLTNRLKQAEHHYNMGHSEQAIKHMQDFIKHLNNDALSDHVTTNAKNILNSDAEALIRIWQG